MKHFFLFCLLLHVLPLRAQQDTTVFLPDGTEVTITNELVSSFEDQIDFIFENLDFTDVTTVLLIHCTIPLVNVKLMEGWFDAKYVY